MYTFRLVLGLLATALTAVFVARRVRFLSKLIASGQPDHHRGDDLGARAWAQFREVFAQARLLRWSIPGFAHFFTFWAFVLLLTVYVEAYGALFDPEFHIPFIGQWSVLGFIQDFIATMLVISLAAFAIMRIRQNPARKERKSRFYGSHTGGAWLILFMIFNVAWTMFLFRGASAAVGVLPYDSGAYVSLGVGSLLEPLGMGFNEVLETVGLLLHIGVMLSFMIIVVYSKHLHIFIAPINVSAKRLPDALGPLQPMESAGKPIDFEDPDDEATFGRGKIEDFTWKGMLDFATCTECGRCQSQCPAWNTEKPLSPKLVIMNLRDHAFAKAPYILGERDMPDHSDVDVLALAGAGNGHHVPESGYERVPGTNDAQAVRPLVGDAEAGGVIDPEVLWSCTTCGACVEQCPVDIEHVDHIVDMRRYQVLIESEFPTELGTLFKNLENKGNPWGQNNSERMDWAKDLDFEVPVFDGELSADTEYLYWIGCAGAFDDNAKKTVRATAELLHLAGVNYVVLGKEESCTGDPARRSGNEFLFQMMAQQTVEMLNSVFEGREPTKRKIVTTCPHCMNTLGREYPQLDGHYEVVHHTQLLNKLVREKKLVPVKRPEDAGQPVTYHDPCYLGRHNKVYEAPRELVGAAGAKLTEMPRHADRSMCCGAGGARMWMEERIGKRINLERVDEAIDTLGGSSPSGSNVTSPGGTGSGGTIATGCPFCRVMVSDGLTERQSEDSGVGVQVRDVSQMLLESVKRGQNGSAGGAAPSAETDAEPSPEAEEPATETPATVSNESPSTSDTNGAASDAATPATNGDSAESAGTREPTGTAESVDTAESGGTAASNGTAAESAGPAESAGSAESTEKQDEKS